MLDAVPDEDQPNPTQTYFRSTGDAEVDVIRSVTNMLDQFEPGTRTRLAIYLADRWGVR